MRCRAARKLRRMLGRRGAILLSYGVVWALYGVGQLLRPLPDQRGIRLLLAVLPLNAWAVCWIAVGCVAIVAAWMPTGADYLGFGALLVMLVPWMLSYLASWWPLGDNPRGWISALLFLGIAAPVMVVAGWREPPRPRRVKRE